MRIRPNPNPVDVTERDVIGNTAGIRLVPLESAQAPRALKDVDFAAIQGNIEVSSRHALPSTLAREQMSSPYVNHVVVKAANQHSKQTEDIVAAYRSDACRQAITGNHAYDGFRLSDYFPH
ncbi:MetQ/NlpA family ABC transporter substrate-binding protein [Caballeronia sp. LZ001]|nr:MetQ/NlpA family ABC transporter substrate-binding protein [Caballeronia sp. LZ001]